MSNLNERLWVGVELKLENAAFQLDQMTKAIAPPARTGHIEGSGRAGRHLWHTPFYASVDAFLSAGRSVAEIIKCCFGEDRHPALKTWFAHLSPDEQKRRRAFQKEFQSHYDAFCNLPLAQARHISEHRTGYAPVTVEISGLFGVTYAGGPTKGVPIAEATPQPEDPSMPRRPTHLAPIRPSWADFDIGGQSLFPACQAFLQGAGALVSKAREIANRVHGTHTITTPPS